MDKSKAVAVYGAAGHTAKFVAGELRRRQLPAILVSRGEAAVAAELPTRIASIDDPHALDRAFSGCGAIINCAGPFLDTAAPVLDAALRAGCSYIDITAEQASAKSTFETYDEPARRAGITVIPAAGFYGGLADLLATVLVGDAAVDEITVAVALDHWWPTPGTRRTGERNRAPRVIIEDGRLMPMSLPPRNTQWTFDAPFGFQPMIEVVFSEVITISRHLDVRRLHSYLNTTAIEETRDPTTPPPAAIDRLGRSAQRFAMEVVAATSNGTQRAKAHGQDIYAVSAPIVVEAAARLLDPSYQRRGALALAEAFEAADFLRALAPAHLTVEEHAGER
jgi:short subunit dehydrogenase-like uncharacterized protein